MKANSNSSTSEMIAMDNFKISYGPCFLLTNKLENDKRKVSKLKRSTNSLLDANTTGIVLKIFKKILNKILKIPRLLWWSILPGAKSELDNPKSWISKTLFS